MARAAKAAFLIVLFAAPAHAADSIVAATAQVGVEHFDYTETLPPPAKSTERAWLPTVALAVETTAPFPLFARLSFLYQGASGTYDGSIVEPTTGAISPSQSTTKHSMFQPEADVGLRWEYEGLWMALYGGLGYRGWKRDLGGPGGYVERYSWGYWAVGFLAEHSFDRFVVTLDATLLPGFSGSMTAQLDSLDPRIADTTTEPIAKMGGRVRGGIGYQLTDRVRIGGVLTYESSKLDASKTVTLKSKNGQTFTTPDGQVYTIFEPASSTHRYGLAITTTLVF